MNEELRSRIEDVLMTESKFRPPELRRIIERNFVLSVESNRLNNLLDRLILLHQSMSLLQPDPDNTIQIIASTKNRHLTKFLVGPAGEIDLSTDAEILSSDFETSSVAIELEEDEFAAEDEEVGIFCDDSVDDAGSFEVGELWIRFVRCDDVLQSCQCLFKGRTTILT